MVVVLTLITGQVAIRVPRASSKGDDFRDVSSQRLIIWVHLTSHVYQSFQREASRWSIFDHPNLLPLWGIIDFQNRLCAVSPWMANGTAIDFVRRHSNIDFLKMLSEITEGAWSSHPFRCPASPSLSVNGVNLTLLAIV
jgi:hypothetical protein